MNNRRKRILLIYEGVKDDYNCIDEEHWLIACRASQKRASILVKCNSLCTYDYFIHNLNQENLYLYQKQNYINNGHLLCILNSVPLFLLEYYQEDFWKRVIAVEGRKDFT